jgi:hypothetical protein
MNGRLNCIHTEVMQVTNKQKIKKTYLIALEMVILK